VKRRFLLDDVIQANVIASIATRKPLNGASDRLGVMGLAD
jgi:hypothetical protein